MPDFKSKTKALSAVHVSGQPFDESDHSVTLRTKTSLLEVPKDSILSREDTEESGQKITKLQVAHDTHLLQTRLTPASAVAGTPHGTASIGADCSDCSHECRCECACDCRCDCHGDVPTGNQPLSSAFRRKV